MEGKMLVVAKALTLLIALVGLSVMIYGWFINKQDAPVVLSGILVGLILAVLGISQAKPKPDPSRDNATVIKKDDDVDKNKDSKVQGLITEVTQDVH